MDAPSRERRANSVENILISGVPEEEGFFAQLREGITHLTGHTIMHKKKMRPCCQEAGLDAPSRECRANSVENILISGVPVEEGLWICSLPS